MLSAWRSGRSSGAQPWPQLPTSSVVTPWATALSAAGSTTRVKSEWLWMSMKPGRDDATGRIKMAGGLDARRGRGRIDDDPVAADPDVATDRRRARAVDDHAAHDDELRAVAAARRGSAIEVTKFMIYDTEMPPPDRSAARSAA